MGRTDDLKAKFRKKGEAANAALDSDLISFKKMVNNHIASKSAEILSSDNEWLCQLYEEAKDEKPASLESFILEKTKGLFISHGSAPRWVLERTWCFHDERPLEFVGQMTDAEAEEPSELYIFAGFTEKAPSENARYEKRKFYKMMIQDETGEIVVSGVISQ